MEIPFIASDINYGFKFIQGILRACGGFYLGKRKYED